MKIKNLVPILFASVLIGSSELAATASADYVYLDCIQDFIFKKTDSHGKTRTYELNDDDGQILALDEKNSRLSSLAKVFADDPEDCDTCWRNASFGSNRINFESAHTYKDFGWKLMPGLLLFETRDTGWIDRSSGRFSNKEVRKDKEGNVIYVYTASGICKRREPNLF